MFDLLILVIFIGFWDLDLQSYMNLPLAFVAPSRVEQLKKKLNFRNIYLISRTNFAISLTLLKNKSQEVEMFEREICHNH